MDIKRIVFYSNWKLPWSNSLLQNGDSCNVNEVHISWFRGERRRQKADFSLKMYEDEVQVCFAYFLFKHVHLLCRSDCYDIPCLTVSEIDSLSGLSVSVACICTHGTDTIYQLITRLIKIYMQYLLSNIQSGWISWLPTLIAWYRCDYIHI